MTTLFNAPTCLSDFALKPTTREKLEHLFMGIENLPAHGVSGIILWGPYGSGKTTMARWLPHAIDCIKTHGPARKETAGELMIDVSDGFTNINYYGCAQGQNGVQLVSKIEAISSLICPSMTGIRYFILDEFDVLTAAAQASMKAVMTHAKDSIFIMTTNHYNQVDPGVIDRSLVLDMNAAPDEAWREKLARDYANANEAFDWEAIQPIVQQGRGSCRRILSDLDKVARLKKAA